MEYDLHWLVQPQVSVPQVVLQVAGNFGDEGPQMEYDLHWVERGPQMLVSVPPGSGGSSLFYGLWAEGGELHKWGPQ